MCVIGRCNTSQNSHEGDNNNNNKGWQVNDIHVYNKPSYSYYTYRTTAEFCYQQLM